MILISPGGSDYTPVGPIAFTFNATVNQFSFDVPVIADEVFEVTENLTATLSFPASVVLPRASIRDGTTQISIFNNSKHVQTTMDLSSTFNSFVFMGKNN